MLENVLNSIINPNDITIYDEGKPYSFLRFIKFFNGNISTNEIISEYNTYIQKWCETKYNQYDKNVYKEIVRQQYIALLKEIELDYTTVEEKRFLNALSFNDETLNDSAQLNSLMDIIIPFYIDKINSICKYYINKREEYKFNVQNDKVICSPEAISKFVKDIILDEISTNISQYNSIPLSSLDTLPQILTVDVTNLYDQTDYFNKNKTYDVNNTNEIPYKAFYDYDGAVVDAIRQYPFYLLDNDIYCFSVNPGLTSDDIDYLPIKEFIYNYKSSSSNKNDIVLNLQKRLIEKFTGSDYYYIQTDENNTPMSGVLIEAENDILNILNVDIVNTPTIVDGDYGDIRRLGLNFTPDRFGLLFYNTNNLRYSIDTTKLQPNSIYIFPDPNRFNRYDVPLVWFIDPSKIKLNKSSQFAEGRPKSDPLYQYFYSYFSTNQKQDSQDTKLITFKKSFESLFDEGIITQYKNDSFGNEYALFKKDDYYKNPKVISDSYIKNGTVINEHDYLNLILDGNISSVYFSAINLSSDPLELCYYLKMGDLIKNNFKISSIYDAYSSIIDGDAFIVSGLSSYNTTKPGWPDLNDISYSTLLDAGISGYLSSNDKGNYTIQVPINGLELSSNDITLDGYLSICDGGYWYTSGYTEQTASTDENYSIISQETTTTYDDIPTNISAITITEQLSLSGNFYFKNAYTGEILPAISALSAVYNKYAVDNNSEVYKQIYNELSSNNITNIDIINDVIFITTENYIVYDKIEWDSNSIVKSVYNPSYIDLRKDKGEEHYFDKPSTYFYLEKNNRVAYVQFTKMEEYDNVYYPVLNLIDLQDLNITKLKFNNTYPSWTASEFDFDFLMNNYYIVRMGQPKLIYNSLNNLYNLNMFLYTDTGIPFYYNISFKYNISDIILYSNRFYDINAETINEGNIDING